MKKLILIIFITFSLSSFGQAISVTAASTDENCGHSNGTATATPSGGSGGGYTYLWSVSPQQSTQTATNLPAGSYTVTVNCGTETAMASVTINNIPGPSVSITGTANTTCGNANGSATATAFGGNSPYNFTWSNSQSGPTLINVMAGTYTVTVTDANACSAINTLTITNAPGPTVSITSISNSSCGMANGSATLGVNGGTPPYTYYWNTTPGMYTQTLQNVPAGSYCVSVTDANGCVATTCVTIGQNPGPIATVTSTNETCGMANGTAHAGASGGSGTFTYFWSDGQATNSALGLSQGTYSVTVFDGYCSASATFNILEIPGPSAAFTMVPDTVIQHHYYVINNASGIPPLSYLWSWGDGTSDTTAYPTHTYSIAGNYTICLSITDSTGAGCTGTYCDSSYLQKSQNTIISVDVIPSETTGLNVNELSDRINIYPNPAANILTLEATQKSAIEILNIQGQLVKTLSAIDSKTRVDVSTFPDGVYIVEVKTEKGIVIKRFVKD
jgi:hypothetical protein